MSDKHEDDCLCLDCANARTLEMIETQCNSSAAHPARVKISITIDKDELRCIENLAWMVKNSKQNVGLRMLDAADSVIKILGRKKAAP
jgi:hypothetical protein